MRMALTGWVGVEKSIGNTSISKKRKIDPLWIYFSYAFLSALIFFMMRDL